MVLEVDGIPAVGCRRLLAGGEGTLEVRELPLGWLVPDFVSALRYEDVAELKQHVERAVLAHPASEFGRVDAVCLSHGKGVVALHDLTFELAQEVQDTRRVGGRSVDGREPVGSVDRPVLEFGLLYVRDGIDAESSCALVEPEPRHIVQLLAHGLALPVEVRLEVGEGVQVVLLAALAPRPGRATKDAAPVRGGTAVLLCVAPDVPVGFGIVLGRARLLEPLTFVGGVVHHEVHYDEDAALTGFQNELVHVVHGAVARIDVVVVRHVVAVVLLWRDVNGREPDRANAEVGEVVELFGKTGERARTFACGVQKALWVGFVHNRVLPPGEFVSGGLSGVLRWLGFLGFGGFCGLAG